MQQQQQPVLVIGLAKRIIAALMRNMCASRGGYSCSHSPYKFKPANLFFPAPHTHVSGRAIFMPHPGCHCLTKNLVKHHRRRRRRRCCCRCARPASLCASTLILHVKRLSLSPTPPPKTPAPTPFASALFQSRAEQTSMPSASLLLAATPPPTPLARLKFRHSNELATRPFCN